jgi:hypothetical protein
LVAEGLLAKPETKKTLGIKAINLWLRFKIYEAMDILKNLKGSNENKVKRGKVGEAYAGYKFPGSNLPSLLRECCKTIGQGEEDIADYIDMIEEKNKAEVEQVFYKEPEQEPEPITYNPDKSVGE